MIYIFDFETQRPRSVVGVLLFAPMKFDHVIFNIRILLLLYLSCYTVSVPIVEKHILWVAESAAVYRFPLKQVQVKMLKCEMGFGGCYHLFMRGLSDVDD